MVNVTDSNPVVASMLSRVFRAHFFRFLCVGGFATSVQWAVLALLVEVGGLGETLASAMSYLLSSVVNYLLNYYFTFASTKSHSVAGVQFIGVVLIGLLVNTSSFALLLKVLPHYLLAQVGATAAALVTNYLLHKYWIYRK